MYLLAVHIVMSSPVDAGVYTEHQSVVEMLVGCGDVVVSTDECLALRKNPVAEAVGPSTCVYLLTKVLCLASHHYAWLSPHSYFRCVQGATHLSNVVLMCSGVAVFVHSD